MKPALCLAIVFLSLALGLCLCGEVAGIDNAVENLVLRQDELPGMTLQSSSELNGYWAVVTKLPDYMKKPENPAPEPGVTDVLDAVELSDIKKDGVRQVWICDRDKVFAAIDYGVCDSPSRARDTLCYTVYERSLPNYSSYYYTYNPYAPAMGYAPYSFNNYIPSCYKVTIGDLGYWVAYPNGGGGSLFFIKGAKIFMVDSLHQSVEQDVAAKIVEKR